MSQGFIDDITGRVIKEGRSYRLETYYGSGDMVKDVVEFDDLIELLREVLTGEEPAMPLQITVQTWTHGKRS